MVLAGTAVAALVIGFLSGLLSFKKTEQFCGTHGITKTCSLCVPVESSQ